MKAVLLIVVSLCFGLTLSAQTMSESDYVRRGNKLYADSLYEKAEVQYRKALELNGSSVTALYNLGNALFNQVQANPNKAQEALESYMAAAELETDEKRLSMIYHNMGVLYYSAQQYPLSVEAYKESMRNNPLDHETRYNLAMAIHMANKQQDQDQNQDSGQDQNQEQQQQNQQQQQEQQEQQQQEQKKQEQQQQNEDKISKENAEQILNALMQDEKEFQEKQQKMIDQRRGKTLEKDW